MVHTFRRVGAAAVFLLALGVVVDTAAGPSWPMHHGNAAHTGYVPVTLDPTRFSLRWQQLAPGSGTIKPRGLAVADGRVFGVWSGVYASRFVTHLMALDAASGRVLWDQDLGFLLFASAPSHAYGNVYIQIQDGSFGYYLRAYDATSGELAFRQPHTAISKYAPTVQNGIVYVPDGRGLSGYDARTGAPRFFAPMIASPDDHWTPAVDGTQAYAYMGPRSSGFAPAGLFAVDAVSGATAFMIEDPTFAAYFSVRLNLAPVIGGANDVLVIHEEKLISFDLATRQKRWQVQDRFGGQPAVARGVVYALNAGRDCACGNSLNARDEVTGALLWEWRAPETLIWGVIVTDSHALVSSDIATYALDLRSHRVAWSIPIGGDLTLGEGVLYIAQNFGHRLFAVDTMTAAGEPQPDIKVNGVDGPVTLRQGEPLAITLSLDPAARNGQPADWWVYARLPGPDIVSSGPTYWVTPRQGWVRSNVPLRAYDAPLMRLEGFDVGRPATLPRGRYDFVFAIDEPDGAFTGRFFDSVAVTIQ